MNTKPFPQALLSQLQAELLKKKEHLEKELSVFAKKDPKVRGDWDSQYPRTPGGNLEEAADEVEEYSTRLDLEFNLETQLKNINAALEKAGKGQYGICEKCKNPIDQERLKVSPEARLCGGCLTTGGLPKGDNTS